LPPSPTLRSHHFKRDQIRSESTAARARGAESTGVREKRYRALALGLIARGDAHSILGGGDEIVELAGASAAPHLGPLVPLFFVCRCRHEAPVLILPARRVGRRGEERRGEERRGEERRGEERREKERRGEEGEGRR